MQRLPSGEEGHDVTISVTPENKLRNRFKNIKVCESFFYLVADTHKAIKSCVQMITIESFFNLSLLVEKSMRMSYINASYVDVSFIWLLESTHVTLECLLKLFTRLCPVYSNAHDITDQQSKQN